MAALASCIPAGQHADHDEPVKASPVEPADPEYDLDSSIWVRELRIRQRLAMPQIGSFAQLTPAQRQRLQTLQHRSAHTVKALVAADRMLLTFSPRHPAADTEILICEDRDRIYAFDTKRRVVARLPRSALPDLLDLSSQSSRHDHEAAFAPDQQPATEHATADEHFNAQIGFEYQIERRGRSQRWKIQLELTADQERHAAGVVENFAVHHIALPLLQDDLGLGVLAALAEQLPQLKRWQLRLRNAAYDGPPVIRQAVVIYDQPGRVPLRRLSTHRTGFRRSTALFRARRNGAQTTPPESLGGLRLGDQNGELKVANSGAHAVWVYVDGAELGWVAPAEEFTFSGLSAGFYRVYAVSPSGVRSVGPADIYLPGSWPLP